MSSPSLPSGNLGPTLPPPSSSLVYSPEMAGHLTHSSGIGSSLAAFSSSSFSSFSSSRSPLSDSAEKSKCILDIHMSSGWFDCTEPSL